MSAQATPLDAGAPGTAALLPLFPLQTVLFPDGLLQLKVFEARYLDLISTCLRVQAPFGVVCMNQGAEVQRAGPAVRFEAVGVLADVIDVDAEQASILQVRCRGGQRMALSHPQQRADGLWLARPSLLPEDTAQAVPEALQACADALAQAVQNLADHDQHPFLEPLRLQDAGWVANRWCEILPISLAAKQRLMVLDEPLLRLKLVDDFLRSKGVY